MSEPDSSRRVIAELRFGTDRSVIAKVGSRSIHQYWHLLAPDFQGILLAPQRRPDEGGVAWTWREAAENQPLTAPELAAVRERLTKANRSFAKNLPDSDADSRGGRAAQETTDQLRSKVDEIVTKLVGKADEKLAAFVGRTDAGPMLHSWGASVPAKPYYPDAQHCEVSGVVLVGDKDAADFEVVIESRKGVCLARTQSDATGAFRFEKIGPGTHRVRVISDRVDFPVNGVAVTVERTSVTNVELRSTSLNVASAVVSPPGSPISAARIMAPAAAAARQALESFSRAPPRRRWLVASFLAVLAIMVFGGGWWTWRWWHSGNLSAGREAGAFPTDVRPLSAGNAKEGQPPPGTTRASDTGFSANSARSTSFPRGRALSAASSSSAPASAKSPSMESTRALNDSSKPMREPRDRGLVLDRQVTDAGKDNTKDDPPAASEPPDEKTPAEEIEDASGRRDQHAVPGTPQLAVSRKSPKTATAADGKTRKSTPVVPTATARASVPANGTPLESAPASPSRVTTPAPTAASQAAKPTPATGVEPANPAEPEEAGDAVDSPDPGEGPAAAVAAADKQPAKTARSVAGKSGRPSTAATPRSAPASAATNGSFVNPTVGTGQSVAAPARSGAGKAAGALASKNGAPADATPPAETTPAVDFRNPGATSEVGETSATDQAAGSPVATTTNETGSTTQGAGTTSAEAAAPANGPKPAAAPDADRSASAPLKSKAAKTGKGQAPAGVAPASEPAPAETAGQSDSPDSDPIPAPPELAPPADQKAAPSTAAAASQSQTPLPIAPANPTETPPTAAAAAVNPAARPSSASAKRTSPLPKTKSTRVPNDPSVPSDLDDRHREDREASRGDPDGLLPPDAPRNDSRVVTEDLQRSDQAPVRLVRAAQVRMSAWAPRLVQDVILPTQPVKDGEDDTMDLLRERMIQERKNQIPQTLKHPVVQFGFALEISASDDGQQLCWRDQAGKEPAGATVSGQRAEISWSGGTPPRDGDYLVGYPGLRDIARITTDSQGGLVLETAKDVTCRYWVAIERASTDEAGLSRTQGASRFDWRLLHVAQLPPSWVRDDSWLGGRGQRLELPLDSRDTGTKTISLALVDRITGWAIVSEVSQAVDVAVSEKTESIEPGIRR